MAMGVMLVVLFGVCLETSYVQGVTFSLKGTYISTSGNEVADINDIGDDNDCALLCRSERQSGEVRMYPNWFLDPDGTSPYLHDDNRLKDETYEIFGWIRNRIIDSEDRRIVFLRRQSPIALEGYFTCDIKDDNNTPRGLYILYPLSVTVWIEIVSWREGTFRVTCSATGGRLSSSTLTGPGLPSSGLSLQRVGDSSDRGQNTYSRTSGTLSENIGSIYTCRVTNDVSSSDDSVVLTGNITLASSPSSPITAGDNVTLTCSISLPDGVNASAYYIQWEGPLGVIPTPSEPTMTTSSVITFSEITTSQAGPYTCIATLRGAIRATTTLIVRIPVSNPSISINTDPIAGTALLLFCNYTLSPSVDTTITTVVRWIVNGSELFLPTIGNIGYIDRLTTWYTGRYACSLTMFHPPQTSLIFAQSHVQSAEVVIYFEIPKPGVAITLSQTALLYAGTSLILTCTVTLDPNVNNRESVVIEWSGPQPIPGDRYSVKPAMRMSGSNYTSNLTIIPLTYQDDGTYTCMVTVTGGTTATASDDVTIDVIAQPESVTIHLVNATAVRISWSSSPYHSTSLQYTSYFTDTGSMINRFEKLFPPLVNSTDITVDLDKARYEHNFTLQYIATRDIMITPAPVTTANFAFDKEYFQIRFGPIDYCLNWGLEKTSHIEDQLHSELALIIRESCTDCYEFSTAYLRQGLFLCHSNPTTVTYRSTLVNPFPTTNSTEILDIIQNWVSSSPTLVIDGLLVRASPDCPTCISSLGDHECVSGDQSGSAVAERISQVLSEICTDYI